MDKVELAKAEISKMKLQMAAQLNPTFTFSSFMCQLLGFRLCGCLFLFCYFLINL